MRFHGYQTLKWLYFQLVILPFRVYYLAKNCKLYHLLDSRFEQRNSMLQDYLIIALDLPPEEV